jgi:hypothetical protein
VTTDADDIRALLDEAATVGPNWGMPPDPGQLMVAGRRRIRRRRTALSVVGTLIVAAAIVLPLTVVSRTPASPTVGSVKQLATTQWQALPTAPIPGRSKAMTAWTGQQLLVWGGMTDKGVFPADGAAYDADTRTWQKLPTGPLSGRTDAVTVWTGDKLFLWGGKSGVPYLDGALYDPATRRWTDLPAAPLPRGLVVHQAVGAWTGSKVLLVILANGRGSPVVLNFNPSTDAWSSGPTVTPPKGHAWYQMSAVATGGKTLLWLFANTSRARQVPNGGIVQTGGIAADAFDLKPDGSTWIANPTLGSANVDASTSPPLPAGNQAIVPPGRSSVSQIGSGAGISSGSPPRGGPAAGQFDRYGQGSMNDLTTGRRVVIPAPPRDSLTLQWAWTGSALVGMDRGDVVAWSAATGHWTNIAIAGPYGPPADVFWTGSALLGWTNQATLEQLG